ncbi:MAG: DNA polymerase III subunit gamma/tau [Chloroflexi bacterium]|nr:DNA polymerase III subunit gamma/tau [Chloroflexota bacterium]
MAADHVRRRRRAGTHRTHAAQPLKTGRIRHAYLFSGPRGTGKTTMARLLAKAVNCTHPDIEARPCDECEACRTVNEGRYLDLIEIDAATHTGVDDVRDLREKIQFSPAEGRYKVYIIDEVHRFSGSAFDALLKTLEEPPGHAIFVLATTEIDKVPQTIKSRCLQFEFRRVSVQQVADRLEQITSAEGLNVERAALELVARQGTGSVRDSISLLDQMVSDPNDAITLDLAQQILGTGNRQAVIELVDAIANEDLTRGLYVLNSAIDHGSDPRQYARLVVEHLRSVLLTQTAGADLIDASTQERGAVRPARRRDPAFKAGTGRARIQRSGQRQPRRVAAPASARTCADRIAAGRRARAGRLCRAYGEPPQIWPCACSTACAARPRPSNRRRPARPRSSRLPTSRRNGAKRSRRSNATGSTGPAVLEHFKISRVDGNLLYIATDNVVYYRRLAGQDQKLKAISRALNDVHDLWLRIQVELVGDAARQGNTDSQVAEDPFLTTARELGAHVLPDSPNE